jgi:NAD(P) transhydrogenase subunit alpha
MVEAMAPGSVVVDLAAERGGNCELTRPDETVVHRGVTILGPSNPPALVPYHASQMYSKNITTFLAHLLGKDGASQPVLPINADDEITKETLLTRGGDVVHPRVRAL